MNSVEENKDNFRIAVYIASTIHLQITFLDYLKMTAMTADKHQFNSYFMDWRHGSDMMHNFFCYDVADHLLKFEHGLHGFSQISSYCVPPSQMKY